METRTNLKFKDVANLYLGCEVLFQNEIHFLCGMDRPYKTNDKTLISISVRPNDKGFRSVLHSITDFSLFKPLLLPLSAMTEEDFKECGKTGFGGVNAGNSYYQTYSASAFTYLLSKGYDLFQLIPSGEAIDKTTFNK